MEVITKNSYFNQEGYADPTPYKAIKNEYFRGEIFDHPSKDGLYLIVSPEHRRTDKLQSVIKLSDKQYSSSVAITTVGGIMYASPGTITFIQESYLGNYICSANADEMEELDRGLKKALWLKDEVVTKVVEKEVEAPVGDQSELYEAKAEAKVYKRLYEELLGKLMKVGG